jgi:hypothetical protein
MAASNHIHFLSTMLPLAEPAASAARTQCFRREATAPTAAAAVLGQALVIAPNENFFTTDQSFLLDLFLVLFNSHMDVPKGGNI